MVSGVVPSDDGFHLPPLQFIIELMATDSDFAHEYSVYLVGANQFFGFSSPWLSSKVGGSDCSAFFSSASGL